MVGRLLIIALLVSFPLAGCLTPEAPSEDVETSSQPDSQLAAALGAVEESPPSSATPTKTGALQPSPAPTPAPGLGDWWLATAQATPEGGATTFWWTIPDGARVPWNLNERVGTDHQVVALEAVPILPEGASPEAITTWGLVGFREDAGVLVPDGGWFETAMTSTVQTTGEAPATEEYVAELMPTSFDVALGEPDVTRIAFLLLARSTTPMEFGVAFRVLDHDPEHEDVVDTTSAFIAARNGTAPRLLTGATASGFALSGYSDSVLGGFPVPAPATRWTDRIGDVTVNAITDASGSVQRLDVATHPTDGSWSIADASYFGWGHGATSWSLRAENAGGVTEGSGVGAEAFVGIFAGDPVWTIVGASRMGDGAGPVSAALAIDHVGTPPLLRFSSTFHLSLAATLESLFGVPAATEDRLYTDGTTVSPGWLAMTSGHLPSRDAFLDALGNHYPTRLA